MEWFASHWLSASKHSGVSTEQLKILDIGSYDVNGSYRPLFEGDRFHYTGLDMAPGPNVDLVPDSPYRWHTLSDDSFDVVISGQALEHVEFFWLIVAEMVRVTKQGGLLCIIAPRGFDKHRYPVDCYRFLADGMIALARYTNLEILHAHCDCQPNNELSSLEWHLDDKEDSLLIARKPYAGRAQLVDVDQYQCKPADLEQLQSPLVSYSPTSQIERNITSQEAPAGYANNSDNSSEPQKERTLPLNVLEKLKRFFSYFS